MIKLASIAAMAMMALGGSAAAKTDEHADRAAIHELLIAYGSTEPVEEAELKALTLLGEQVVSQARYVFADWFV